MSNLFKKQSAKFVPNPSRFTKVMAKHILMCFLCPTVCVCVCVCVIVIRFVAVCLTNERTSWWWNGMGAIAKDALQGWDQEWQLRDQNKNWTDSCRTETGMGKTATGMGQNQYRLPTPTHLACTESDVGRQNALRMFIFLPFSNCFQFLEIYFLYSNDLYLFTYC